MARTSTSRGVLLETSKLIKEIFILINVPKRYDFIEIIKELKHANREIRKLEIDSFFRKNNIKME